MAKGRYNPSYSFERDLFQLLGETRWEANDYRLGLDATYRRWDFAIEQLYRNFRNDPDITSRPGVDPGANLGTPPPVGAISFLDRDIPLRARSLVTGRAFAARSARGCTSSCAVCTTTKG